MTLQILLPMAANNKLLQTNNQPYPTTLIELEGKPIIKLVVENYEAINGSKKFAFIINKEDCKKFHLDNSLKLVTHENKDIIVLDSETKGSACSCLMAVDKLDLEQELIIANSDQVFDIDLNKAINYFREQKAAGGVITFESIHPRWSYAIVDAQNQVLQAAEKNPISNTAIAGLYYFAKAKYFIEGAMKSIEKDSSIDGRYFISPTLNEMILKGLKVKSYKITNKDFHTFYSPEKIKEFERKK